MAIALLSLSLVIVLAIVTFLFIKNTKKNITDIKYDINNKNVMIKNNLDKMAKDYHYNDDVLNTKYSTMFDLDSDTQTIDIKKNTKIIGTLQVCDSTGDCKNVLTN